jgi:hypothetical protein
VEVLGFSDEVATLLNRNENNIETKIIKPRLYRGELNDYSFTATESCEVLFNNSLVLTFAFEGVYGHQMVWYWCAPTTKVSDDTTTTSGRRFRPILFNVLNREQFATRLFDRR